MFSSFPPEYILQIMLIDVHKLQGYVHWDNGVNSFSPPYIVSVCTLIYRNLSPLSVSVVLA